MMTKPDNRYAVFLDIDGTLISDKFIVPKRNLEAIAAARKLGHMVFISTGRSWGNIPLVLLEQLDVDGIVAGSGAMVTIGGETVFKASMTKELSLRLAEYFWVHPEFWCVFEGLNEVYMIENEVRRHESFQTLLSSPQDIEEIYNHDEIQVLAMGVTAPPDFIRLFSDEITVFQFERYADCVIKGLNKAKGIEKVLEITGIRRENTIAIGDSGNDYDMINYAGIGVAMGNSEPKIIEAADFVTDTNYNCGVAKAIEKFLL